MKLFSQLYLIIVFFGVFFTNEARCAFQFIPTVGMNNSTPQSRSRSYSSENAMLAGAIIELPTPGSLGLEFGFFLLNRKFNTTTISNGISTNTSSSANFYHVPALLRWHFLRFFSLGVGGYFSRAHGSVDQVIISNGGRQQIAKTYAQAGYKDRDYGAVASFRVDIPMSLITGLMFETRYLQGLSNVGSEVNGPIVKYRDLQFMAGFRIGFAN